MTVSSTPRRAGPFLGNDVTASFPFTFKVFSAAEVQVTLKNAAGVESVLTSGFTVTLNADQDNEPGGSVGYPLATGESLTITGDLPAEQQIDLTNLSRRKTQAIENGLDYLTVLVQQLEERQRRALVTPISDEVPPGQLPSAGDRKGTVLAFDPSTGEPVVGPQIAAVGTVAATAASVATVAANIDAVNTTAANIAAVVDALAQAEAAASSAAEALSYLQAYRATSYGALSADPVVDPNGNSPTVGDEYFNTTDNLLKRFNGATWQASDIDTANLAASGGSALIGHIQPAAGAVVRTLQAKMRDIVDLRDFVGGSFSEANDYTSEINAAVAASVGLRLLLPAGTIRTRGIVAANGIPRFCGQGTQRTKLTHIDGHATPLLWVQGGTVGVPTPAWPTDGYTGITFFLANQTTAALYYDGQIDSNVLFDDIAFSGAGNVGGDAISVKDFLNWKISRVRWDAIDGWGIRVRDADSFSSSRLTVDSFSYDNGGAGARGQGLCYIDASGLGTIKGIASFRNGRIELNSPLASAKPARAVFRAVQNNALLDNGPAQVYFSFANVVADASGANKDCKFVSCDYRNVGIVFEGEVTAYGFNEFYNNDAGNAAGIPAYPTTVQRFTPGSGQDQRNVAPSRDSQNRFLGLNLGTVDSFTNLNNFGRMERGDFAYFTNPNNTSGGASGANPFALKAVQNRSGVCDVVPANLPGTGSITAGTAALVMTADIGNTIVPGVALDIPGAGAAAATLQAKIRAVDYATRTITLDTNASTTVSGQVVSTGRVQYMAVDMVTYSAGVPTTGTFVAGNIVVNTNFSPTNPVKEYVCIASGTPGAWRACKWRVTKNNTASRPTLGASDVGVVYLDDTLTAAGKPIWWTGSQWVDATGAVV